MDCFKVDWSWPSPNDPGGTHFGPFYDPNTRREIAQRPPRTPDTSIIHLEIASESNRPAVLTQLDLALANTAALDGWKGTIWGRDLQYEWRIVVLVGESQDATLPIRW